ncbi:MAG: hypothetical protein ACRC1T_05495 [Clostridium chrysemydis]|uniref:hypothetical protein n=1 Tax=Clostridium chrysemydis TaxID=2665504 RepID=UPI003F2BF18B
MSKRCPVCGSRDISGTYPFGDLFCGNCKYDEEFYTPKEYRNKLKKDEIKKEKENTVLACHKWYEDDNYTITEYLYERDGFIESEFILTVLYGECSPVAIYKFDMESMGRKTFIKLKNMESDHEIEEHIDYLINKTGHLTKMEVE